MRYARLLGLSLALLACTATKEAGDAGTSESADSSVSPDPIDCDASFPPRVIPQYHSSLEGLCSALAQDGRARCPKDRSTFLAEVGERCGETRYFPVMTRTCELDIVPALELSWGDWRFDAESGQLVGASVQLRNFVCGAGERRYIGGTQRGESCPTSSACELCLGGPERDATCPAEVLALLPNEHCSAPSVAPGCACTSASIAELPQDDAPCGDPTTCARCQSGTCWAECLCRSDGVARWRVGCTE